MFIVISKQTMCFSLVSIIIEENIRTNQLMCQRHCLPFMHLDGMLKKCMYSSVIKHDRVVSKENRALAWTTLIYRQSNRIEQSITYQPMSICRRNERKQDDFNNDITTKVHNDYPSRFSCFISINNKGIMIKNSCIQYLNVTIVELVSLCVVIDRREVDCCCDKFDNLSIRLAHDMSISHWTNSTVHSWIYVEIDNNRRLHFISTNDKHDSIFSMEKQIVRFDCIRLSFSTIVFDVVLDTCPALLLLIKYVRTIRVYVNFDV
jgi:hypothetical protein